VTSATTPSTVTDTPAARPELTGGLLLRLAVILAIVLAALEIVIRLAELEYRRIPFGAGIAIVWMAPLMNLVWFAGAVVIAVAGRRLWPKVFTSSATLALLLMPAFITLAWLIPKVHTEAALILALGLAVQGGRLLEPRQASIVRLTRRAFVPVLAGALVVLVAATGWHRVRESRVMPALPAPPAGAPNVLLLILDTVRSYSVSGYGYSRPTTPTLDSLIRAGTRFDRAFAPSSWTMPSHATMFTARWPFELRTGPRAPLGTQFPTLAGSLSEAGWATGGFAANHAYLTWEHGLTRGFVRFEGYPATAAMLFTATSIGRTLMGYNTLRKPIGFFDSPLRKTAALVNDQFLEWQEGLEGRPFFATLNYFDAHHPYLPPEPYLTKFGPHGALRWRGGELLFKEFSADEIERKQNQYDGAIAYVDAEVGRLLAVLDQRGVLRNTTVIVTSDHGEHWGEHEMLSHGKSMYRELLQVPLVLAGRGTQPGASVPDVVSLRDLPATVLDIAGLPNETDFPGASLLPLAQGRPVDGRSPAFSEDAPFGMRGARSLIGDAFHYIRRQDGTEQLYDLESDSLARHDVAASPAHQSALRALRVRMDSITGGAPPSDANERPDEQSP
jgi:arylsulfatase A-like enzyme